VAVEFVSQGTPLTAYATWKDLTRAAEAAAAGGHTLALGF
jgi:hypothetical protein